MITVKHHAPPTAHTIPTVQRFEDLAAYFNYARTVPRNPILIWIKDESGAVHYGYIYKEDGTLAEYHHMGFGDTCTEYKSKAFIEASSIPTPKPVLAD